MTRLSRSVTRLSLSVTQPAVGRRSVGGGVPDGVIEAELARSSFDKVDLRTKLRRSTVFPSSVTDFEFVRPYWNRRFLITMTSSFACTARPAGPAGRVILSRSVTLSGNVTSRADGGLKLWGIPFLNTLSRLTKVLVLHLDVLASNQKSTLCHAVTQRDTAVTA